MTLVKCWAINEEKPTVEVSVHSKHRRDKLKEMSFLTLNFTLESNNF